LKEEEEEDGDDDDDDDGALHGAKLVISTMS
jgi:hypothetical protein